MMMRKTMMAHQQQLCLFKFSFRMSALTGELLVSSKIAKYVAFVG